MPNQNHRQWYKSGIFDYLYEDAAVFISILLRSHCPNKLDLEHAHIISELLSNYLEVLSLFYHVLHVGIKH